MANNSDSSPNYTVKRSSLHGRGLFAAQPIKRGSLIGIFRGTPTRRDSSHTLWIWDDAWQEWQGLLGNNELRFTNHSKRPNARFDGVELRALKPIAAGEEITIDYNC